MRLKNGAPATLGRGRRRAMSWLALAATLVAVGVRPAAAQHHHSAAVAGEGRAFAAAAGIAVELGRIETSGASHDYQALAITGQARVQRFELATRVPFVRLEMGSDSHAGLGDVHLEARWLALAAPLEAGLSAAVMPPLGSDEHGLAMGHWMLMGGGFARAARGPASGGLAIACGSRLGEDGHAAHQMSVWPPVAPMNAREIRGALDARIAVWRRLAAVGSLMAAAPIGDGELLAMAGGGLAVGLGRVELGVEAAHGMAGHTAELVIGSHLVFAF